MPWGPNAIAHWEKGKYLAAAAAGLAAYGAGNYTRPMAARNGLSYRRRSYRRFSAKRRRRPYPSRRKFKGKTFRRRGVRFTGKRAAVYRPLRANFAVNDYRRLKFCVDQSSFSLSDTYGGTPVETRALTLNGIAFGNQTTDAGDFTQFKIANLQLVIEPLDKITGATNLKINFLDIPYIAIRFVSASSSTTLNPNLDDLRQTPGYTYVPLQRKKRIVLNTKAIIEKETQLVGASSNILHRTYVPMPWMDITPGANGTESFQFIRCEIYRPRVQLGSVELQYDVRWYGDLMLRGRKVQVIAPDT